MDWYRLRSFGCLVCPVSRFLPILADLATVTEYVDDLRNLFNYSSLAEQRVFIRSFVKEVKVTGDEVLLTYTMPLPPQGISEERVGVLCSVHSSGPEGTIPRTDTVSCLAPSGGNP